MAMEFESSSKRAEDRDCDGQDLSADSEQELLFRQPCSSVSEKELNNSVDQRGDRVLTLKREITPLSGIGFVVGNLIGSGIFITPSVILCYTGSFGVSLVCWVFGGVLALAGSLCFLELGLLVRKTGGEYAILLEAYSFRKKNRWVEMLGPLVSFLYTWTSVSILKGASLSIITLACARHLIRPFFIGCDIPENSVKLLALAFVVILSLVNMYSVKCTAYVTVIFSGLKLISIAFIVGVGLFTVIMRQSIPERLHHPFQPLEGHEPSIASISVALYGVMWAYDGWNVMNYAIEETKNVERTMPIALLIGVPLVAICYLLVNIAFFIVLSYEDILRAEAVALPFGEATLGKAGLVVIPIIVACSTFGSANGSIYTSSRSMFGAAKDRLLPDVLSGLHTQYRTPVPAIIYLAVFSSIMIVIGDIEDLIDSFAAASFVFYLLSFLALIIMRITHPKEPRLFKAYFIIPVTIFAILSSVFLIALPIFQKPIPTLLALGAILLGIPIYILFVMEVPWKLRPPVLDRISRFVTWHSNNLLNTQSSRESPSKNVIAYES